MIVLDYPIAAALSASNEETARVKALMAAADIEAPDFWRPGVGEMAMVPVDGAELRVFHFVPRHPVARRPIVMVPGYGATPEGFQDFYAALRDKAELFYLETREKSSSRITGQAGRHVRRPQRARHPAGAFVPRAGRLARLRAHGPVLGRLDPAPRPDRAHPGRADGACRRPHAHLWFPKWVLRYLSPLLPAPTLLALRPFIARSMLGDMQEPTQKERAWSFVYGADVWKWKKAAEAARDFELFGRLSAIDGDVFVLNGTRDKIHDQRHYPRIAQEMPRGRFISMQTDERNRERLFGVVALEFARVAAADGPRRLLRASRRPFAERRAPPTGCRSGVAGPPATRRRGTDSSAAYLIAPTTSPRLM